MADRIERLGDEWAIRDTLARYWRGVDRRDAALVESTYHPDAYDDHGYYKGPVQGFIASLEPGVWAYFENTQHFSGHIAVEIDPSNPDAALVESYAEAHHLRREDQEEALSDLVYGLRYVDRFTKRNDEWRIEHRICTWDWARTDPSGGIPLPESYFRGHHSKQDPVYQHPISVGRRVTPSDIVAKQACADTLMRYARGVDRCDPELVRSTYHADAFDDHGGYQGDAGGFIDWVKPTVMDTFTCTMHKLGNSLIEVDGNQAFAETYAIAHHVLGDAAEPSDMIMGVRYIDRLEDRGTGWKIAHRRMSFEWERSVSIGSQQAHPGFSLGKRDGSDPTLNPTLYPTLEAPRSSASGAVPAAGDRVAESRAADRAEIYAVLVRYCRGVDRRDLDLIRSTYHFHAYDDHGAFKGDLEGFLRFVEEEVYSRFRTTMHKIGQALIDVDVEGDVATSETYAICHHVRAEDGVDLTDSVMGIRYLDRFERLDGEWRIARRELRWEWIREDKLEALDEDWTLGLANSQDPVRMPPAPPSA